MQRWLLRNPWVRPFIVFSFAASKIQRMMRGFLVRRWGSLRVYVDFRQNKLHRAAKIRQKRLSQPFPDYRGLQSSQASRSVGNGDGSQSTVKRADNKQLDKYLAFTELMAIMQGMQGQGQGQGQGGPHSPVTNRKLYSYSGGGNMHSIKSVSLTNVGRVTVPKWLAGGYSVWCTVRVQAWYRMCTVRRHYFQKKRVITQIAALVIQSAWKALIEFRILLANAAKRARILQTSPMVASTRIQLAWRAYCNRRIYYYYRDLVVNKLQGAPAELLRTIIPNESSLLDKAAGAVVRFRLGSSVFPPKIYFKIFTYRGVCDVNAFAPRDYVREKPVDAVQQNIKDNFIPKDRMKYNRNIRVGATYFDTKLLTATSTDNWYKREEKNPWRPLASQLFEDILAPPWQRDQVLEKAPAPFHFSLLKRKTDVVKLRKQKKREWLRKAYMLAGVDLTGGTYGNANGTGSISGNPSANNSQKPQGVHIQPSNGAASGGAAGKGNNAISTLEEVRRKRNADTNSSARNGNNARTYSADHQQVQVGQGNRNHNAGGGGAKGGNANNNQDEESYDNDGNFSESLAYLSMSHTLDQPTYDSTMQDADDKDYMRRKGGGGADAKGNLNLRMPDINQHGQGGQGKYQQQQLQQQQLQQRPFSKGGPTGFNTIEERRPSSSNNTNNGGVNGGITSEANNVGKYKGNESEDNDDLLQWSMALDFDDYANNWSQLATNRG